MKHKIQTQIRNFISNVPKFNKKQTKCSSRLCPAINADLIPSIKQTITRKGGGRGDNNNNNNNIKRPKSIFQMQFGRFMSSTRRLLVKMLSIGCKQRTTPTTPVVPNWRSIIPPSTSFHQIFLQFSSPFAPVWFSKRNNDDKIIHLEGGEEEEEEEHVEILNFFNPATLSPAW